MATVLWYFALLLLCTFKVSVVNSELGFFTSEKISSNSGYCLKRYFTFGGDLVVYWFGDWEWIIE